MRNKMYFLAQFFLFLAGFGIGTASLNGEVKTESAIICGAIMASILCMLVHVCVCCKIKDKYK